MKNQPHRITCYVGIFIMISAYVVIPEKYPWYYEVLLFNVGLTMWLFAKWKLKKTTSNQSNDDSSQPKEKKFNWLFIVSVMVMLTEALHIIVDNESALHAPLQIVFAAGALSMAFTIFKIKRVFGVLTLVFLSFLAQSQDTLTGLL